jgi:hypothetical protein
MEAIEFEVLGKNSGKLQPALSNTKDARVYGKTAFFLKILHYQLSFIFLPILYKIIFASESTSSFKNSHFFKNKF